VTRSEQTFGRQHQNEHVLATSIVAVPKVSWCCAGRSYTAPTLWAHNTHPCRSAVSPKQATEEQLSKCIGRTVPHDYCSPLKGRNQE